MQEAFSNPYPNLTGQTALITGAGLGFGRAMAIRLAEAIAFLASQGASYITRTTLDIAGGR